MRMKKEVMKMSDMGVYEAKFKVNNRSLEEFDNSLNFIKKKEIVISSESSKRIEKLLIVIEPLVESIQGKLSTTTAISEHSILDIIRERHPTDWQIYKEELISLRTRLKGDKIHISDKDVELLNDVADALDSECADLFKRMSEVSSGHYRK
jgi:hypothetical protein